MLRLPHRNDAKIAKIGNILLDILACNSANKWYTMAFKGVKLVSMNGIKKKSPHMKISTKMLCPMEAQSIRTICVCTLKNK